MSKVIVLKQNSPEIRQKIKDAGISVCICCEFKKAVWLNCYPDSQHAFSVHGIGYSDEDWPVEHELAFVEHDWKVYNVEVIECSSVEEFIQRIKESKGE